MSLDRSPAHFVPSTLRLKGDSCNRWLESQLYGPRISDEPFHRWNIRNALLARLREAHAEQLAPRAEDVRKAPRGLLLPEEEWYFAHFIKTYCEVFSGQPGLYVPHGCENRTLLSSRGVTLGGGVDLLLRRSDGRLELRQLELWGRSVNADPSASWDIALALLRLCAVRVVEDELIVHHVDLNTGSHDERLVDARTEPGSDLVIAAQRFDQQWPDLRDKATDPVPSRSPMCTFCTRVHGCNEWSDRPSLPPRTEPPNKFVGRVVTLNPTSVENWLSCPRWYRARHLLPLPGVPIGPKGVRGILVHERLARLHVEGPCGEQPERVRAVSIVDGELDRDLLAHLERHSQRCPRNAAPVGHELDLMELLPSHPKPAMVSARIDAIWAHDGILDCRDYKTGPVRFERVRDDPAARVQVFVLAPLAMKMGLTLRLRHEHLGESANEDPEVFEPDEDDLAEIEAELSDIAAAIDMSDFAGVSDPVVCGRCPYRLACPDSAAAGDLGPDLQIVAIDLPDLEPEPF